MLWLRSDRLRLIASGHPAIPQPPSSLRHLVMEAPEEGPGFPPRWSDSLRVIPPEDLEQWGWRLMEGRLPEVSTISSFISSFSDRALLLPGTRIADWFLLMCRRTTCRCLYGHRSISRKGRRSVQRISCSIQHILMCRCLTRFTRISDLYRRQSGLVQPMISSTDLPRLVYLRTASSRTPTSVKSRSVEPRL